MGRHPDFKPANVADRVDAVGKGAMGLMDHFSTHFDRTVTWTDIEWLPSQWNGPLVIYGVMAPAHASNARQVGANAVMISNHGGRQLDRAPTCGYGAVLA
jgi:L-lactate dehydrogenase (cytochrome)